MATVSLLRRLRAAFTRSRNDVELREEIEEHIQRANVASGTFMFS
jgi:adenylate kinase